MTQEEQKELLLKDLCTRLPYGVKVGTTDNDGSLENVWDMLWYNTFTEDVKLTHSIEDAEKIIDIKETRPYLIPLSKMTEEQSLELEIITGETIGFDAYSLHDFTGYSEISLSKTLEIIQWCYKNHLDINGLIPMGLANDATDKNIY